MRAYEKGFLFIVVELMALVLVLGVSLFLILDLEQVSRAVAKQPQPTVTVATQVEPLPQTVEPLPQALEPSAQPAVAPSAPMSCPELPAPVVKVEQVYVEDPARLSLQDLLSRLSKELTAEGVAHHVDELGGALFLPDLFLFDAGRINVGAEKQALLGKLVGVLKKVLPCFTIDAPGLSCAGEPGKVLLEGVYVEGHSPQSDIDQPRFNGNWNVAMKRGFSLFESLLKKDRLLNGLRGAQGHSLFKVAGVASNFDVRSDGRRVELRFVMQQAVALENRENHVQPQNP
ncbi:hypothetical protein Mmc1_2246 [Magnetococcus marinus MC-1]|uniref:Uncharacterized protein n=1 Tax=Magnetococcus marinus (strain ATCC BAA-1437 / JCM 17883 / MC-1) TaxID=156889 RepID=A0L9V4_MAGMM|nr:hypothetical protein [Magnetococcus marinus]ABK44747.1 hypothetical protein Mmc1_2246 [Magnetococcus marinus MC-1]